MKRSGNETSIYLYVWICCAGFGVEPRFVLTLASFDSDDAPGGCDVGMLFGGTGCALCDDTYKIPGLPGEDSLVGFALHLYRGMRWPLYLG